MAMVHHWLQEAIRLYKLIADQGNADEAFRLGELYENGIEIAQNNNEAVKWYYRAAKQHPLAEDKLKKLLSSLSWNPLIHKYLPSEIQNGIKTILLLVSKGNLPVDSLTFDILKIIFQYYCAA